MKTVRASEIGTFLYCNRALWYHLQGVPPKNTAELVYGSDLHEHHGRSVVVSGCLRTLAYLLFLSALVILTIYGLEKII
jgi:CRISPR/Cas system-associated exonuclease Cas4 (RecB family)